MVLIDLSGKRWFVLLLLLLGGDVSENPGPVRYPCTVCSRSVHSNHKALQCDNCQMWSHIKCVSISNDYYAVLQQTTDFSWQCPSCLFAALPSLDISSHSDSDTTLSNSMGDQHSLLELLKDKPRGVRVVHHNVQGLFSKLDELSQWFDACADSATVFAFSEVWLRPGGPAITVPGYSVYTSPFLCRPGKASSYLPGSCLIVSNHVIVERSPVCLQLEQSCRLLNMVCCFITCRHTRLFIMAIYTLN